VAEPPGHLLVDAFADEDVVIADVTSDALVRARVRRPILADRSRQQDLRLESLGRRGPEVSRGTAP
jgi:hypothetical protein